MKERHLINTSQANEVGEAHPRIVEAVETMIKKGKWTVPGKLGYPIDFQMKRSFAPRVQGEIWRLEPYVDVPFDSRAIEWNDTRPSFHSSRGIEL